MADSDKVVAGSSQTKHNYNPRLDFFSASFDPLLALRTPDLKPPDASAKIHDNIAKFASSQQPKAQKQNKREMAPQSRYTPIQRNWLPHQLPIQTRNARAYRDVLTKMESMEGPLSLLRKCKAERTKIKVWTRHSHGIRGYCVACVTAFDRHWNLALEDVTEVWTRPKKRKIPALDYHTTDRKLKKSVLPPSATIIKTDKKTETCERYVKQLLIRGEHVAFIIVFKKEIADTSSE